MLSRSLPSKGDVTDGGLTGAHMRACVMTMFRVGVWCRCVFVRREALQQFTPRQLRLMFIMSPWNKTISYGETMRAEMRARESALKNFFQNVDVALRESSKDESSSSAKWQVG